MVVQVHQLNKFQAETLDPGHQCFAAPETLAGVWTQVFHAQCTGATHPSAQTSPKASKTLKALTQNPFWALRPLA